VRFAASFFGPASPYPPATPCSQQIPLSPPLANAGFRPSSISPIAPCRPKYSGMVPPQGLLSRALDLPVSLRKNEQIPALAVMMVSRFRFSFSVPATKSSYQLGVCRFARQERRCPTFPLLILKMSPTVQSLQHPIFTPFSISPYVPTKVFFPPS